VGVGEHGTVDDVRVISDDKGLFVSVRIASVMKPRIGDKFAFRPSQKGTVGMIMPREDMPFDMKTGITPDVIINSHAIPSRMTVGLINEILFGTAASVAGKSYDGTGYQKYDSEAVGRILMSHGLSREGYRKMVSGVTGKMFEMETYIGMAGVQQLLHIAANKAQVRSRGRVDDKTGQAPRGKSSGGAIKFGWMDVRACAAHGAAHFIHERMCTVSDAYSAVYCADCGVIASPESGKYVCRICGDGNFGNVIIPYIFKYFTQIMASVGMFIRSDLVSKDLYMKGERKGIISSNTDRSDIDDDEQDDDYEDDYDDDYDDYDDDY
jgi:DNA-directed RNA polymerase beta subunit